MAVLNIQVSCARPDTYYEQNFETAGGPKAIINRLTNFLTGLATGTEGAMSTTVPPTIAFSVQENMVQASATLTCVSAIATDTVVINGVSFAGVASGATGNQWNVGGTDTLTAAAIAAAINASVTALIAGYVTATSALGVVTVTSSLYGLGGNQVTISTTGGTITASSTRLVGGAVDATAQTLTF